MALARPVLGTGEIPEELAELASTRELYISTEAGADQPRVELSEVEGAENTSTWRVTVRSSAASASAHIPGRAAVRESPATLHAQVDAEVDTTGYRPEWCDLMYQPRQVPHIAATMQRIDGRRRVRPLYIFGPDDRRVFQDTTFPWHCAGKLYNSQGFMGSAALVWGNVIVTAGHMVPWGQSSWWMRFVPDYFDGQSLLGAGVQSYVSDVRGYNTGGHVAGYDWAVCKLYNRLGDTLGYYGFNGYSSSWENGNYWTVVGYPGDVAGGERPSWQGAISIHDDDGDSNGGQELESQTADINHGDSGGPIFGWWSGDPRVIGVVSGEEEEYKFPFSTEDNNIFASGSGFTNLIAWARSNW
jgi:V8-like Glu-specific endopeptidase